MNETLIKNIQPYSPRFPENSTLYKILADNLESFLTETSCYDGKGLPEYVIKTLRAFLDCGIIQKGFVRIKCPACDHEAAIPFSCKKRGFCPSCNAKRQAEIASHLCDNVLPFVPYRQLVLTLPIPLRFWTAKNRHLLGKVYEIFSGEVSEYLVKKAVCLGIKDPIPGHVTFIHWTGSALNTMPHFHMICMEGVYSPPLTTGTKPMFSRLSPPSDEEINELLEKISKKTIKHLRKKGYLNEDPEPIHADQEGLFKDYPLFEEILGASVQSRIALGTRKGQGIRKIGSGFGYLEEIPLVKGPKCCTMNGFSLHAARKVGPYQRQNLEGLIQYAARPPLSNERLSINADGEIDYELKTPWSDGTKSVMFEAREFLEKLIGLIPLPRLHLVRYGGIFASHHKYRKMILLKPDIKKGQKIVRLPSTEPRKVKNTSWARLLARIFHVDIGRCPNCQSDMIIIGAITDSSSISRYLRHLGLATHPPPVTPARRGGEFESFNQESWPQENLV